MFPIPKHLEKILKPRIKRSSEKIVTGTIECSCGCEDLNVFYLGDTHEHKTISKIKSKKLSHGSILIVNSNCSRCKRNNLIFDNRTHGYKRYISNINKDILMPEYELEKWICCLCNKDIFEISITIQSEEKNDIDKTCVKEAFDWIVIGLKCKDCEHEDVAWVDYNSKDDI